MDQFQYQIYRVAKTIGTVVLSCFFVYCPCLEDTGILLLGNTDTWIGFAVLEQDVIVRLVLLDEVVLQQKCILFVIYYYVPYVCYVGY